MTTTRTETDSMGPVQVPSDRYWGAQTQRSLQNFVIGKQRFSPEVIAAFGVVKGAAAEVNLALGLLDEKRARLIEGAAGEVAAGKLDDEFPLVVYQTGSGTQSNMNANEVIAGRANEQAGGPRGGKTPVHPNDHVNMSQSSNDVFPTVMHVATLRQLTGHLLPALRHLRLRVDEKAKEHATLVKIGRTHMMDATPLTLGQELSGYVSQLAGAEARIESSLAGLREIALGGTAVGTGLNAPGGWAERVAEAISSRVGENISSAPNKFAALAAHDAIVDVSGALRLLATACMKMANDIRLLGSGPRAGLAELILPANEPGSSIMPGKVNPTQVEALTMVCARVMGNDVTIGIAGMSGHLELNVFKPLLVHTLLESVNLLGDACRSFADHCVVGLVPNTRNIARNLERSLMLVTALSPRLGYDLAAKVAKLAYEDDSSLKEAALKLGVLTAAEFDALMRPEAMV